MPNLHAARADDPDRTNPHDTEPLLQAILAVAYELRTANLLNAAAHTAAYGQNSWQTKAVERIEEERLS